MTHTLEQRLEEHFHLTQRSNWTAMEIQKLEDFIKAEIATAKEEEWERVKSFGLRSNK